MSVPADPRDPRERHDEQDDERELDEFARLLDRAAADEAAALAEGRALPADQVPGLDRVESILAGLWAGADAGPVLPADADGTSGARPSPPAPAGDRERQRAPGAPGSTDMGGGRAGMLRWALPLAAAALLAVLLWWVQDPPTRRPGDDLPLGGSVIELIEPAGSSVELPTTLRWKGPPGAEGWTYRVRLLDPAGSRDGQPLAESPRTSASSWTVPAPEDGATWPREVILEIEPWDASGQPADVFTRPMSLHAPGN